MPSSQALAEADAALAKLSSVKSLQDIATLAESVSAKAIGPGGVLYSGPIGSVSSRKIALTLAEEKGLNIIDSTARGVFLDNPAVANKIKDIISASNPDISIPQLRTLIKKFLFGFNGTAADVTASLWGRASAEFTASLSGNITAIMVKANAFGVFTNVEAQALLQNTAVKSINNAVIAGITTAADLASVAEASFISSAKIGGIFRQTVNGTLRIFLSQETLNSLGLAVGAARTAAALTGDASLAVVVSPTLVTRGGMIVVEFLAAAGELSLGLATGLVGGVLTTLLASTASAGEGEDELVAQRYAVELDYPPTQLNDSPRPLIGNGLSLQINGILQTDQIDIGSGSRSLLILNPQTFKGTIFGYVGGDTLDLVGISGVTGVTLGPSNLLTIAQSDGSILTLQLDPGRNYAGDKFTFRSDGLGGTNILVSDAAANAVVADLGSLIPGAYNIVPHAINNAGQIVGDASGNAFLWQNGTLIDLSASPGQSYNGSVVSGASAINNAGQIALWSYGISNAVQALLFQDGTQTNLGGIGGSPSVTRGINAAGAIVGNANAINGKAINGFSDHAVLLQGGTITDLGTLGGGRSKATDISDSGQIVGYSDVSGGISHAFLWQSGVMTDLGTLGGATSEALGVNNAGQIVGDSYTARNYQHAYLWQNGVMTDLGTLVSVAKSNSLIKSGATAINEAGQVVGWSYIDNSTQHAFLWQNGVMTDLNSLLSASSGWVLQSATGINDNGQIVGYGMHNGAEAAFEVTLLTAPASIPTPTPTPPTPDQVTLHGVSAQYVVADNGGSLYVQDTVSGRDGTQTLSSVDVIRFTDGVGVFDPRGTGGDVARLYRAALNRAPDVAGLKAWTADIDGSNVPLSAVANAFASSPEFIQDYGSLSDAAFVNQLYLNVLGRPADAAGAQFWDGALASGASRGAVLVGFAESPENKAATISTAGDQNNAEAYRLYQAALDRAPDQAGLTYWSSALARGVMPTQVAQGFINSAEFQQHYGTLSPSDFVSTLYENVLHRAADPTGLQYWTGQLQQGASEASILVGFSDSLENRGQTAGATHANWVFIPTGIVH